MRKQILITGLLYLFIVNPLVAQKRKDFGIKPLWRQGTITFKDETKFEGLVYYNSNFGTIQIKSAQGEIISFPENKILSMSYFDDKLNRSVHYTSLVYKDTLADKEYELFFEVIKDFRKFAVLSRLTTASLLFPVNSNTEAFDILDDFVSKKRAYVQVEGIFFIDKSNRLELYCLIKNMDFDGLLYDYSKSETKILKSKSLKRNTADHWDELKEYIRKNQLDPKIKSHLIRILDHYEQLSVPQH